MNLKTEVTRKQSTPNFPENAHFLPPDTHTYVVIMKASDLLNPFLANTAILNPPDNTNQTKDFLVFSGGIK